MNATLRRGAAGPRDDRACDFQHHRDARGIVVRTRIQYAPADAEMIEMGRRRLPPRRAERRRNRSRARPRCGPECFRAPCRVSVERTRRQKAAPASAARNCSSRNKTAFSPPAPLRPPNSGDASRSTTVRSRPCSGWGARSQLPGRPIQWPPAQAPVSIEARSAALPQHRGKLSASPSRPSFLRESVRLS